MECVLAVDIGTQTVRSGLMTQGGTFVDVATASLELWSPRPGWAEQSPHAWWDATTSTMSEVIERNPDASVAAIAVGAQMHGLVPVDAAGEPLVDRVGIWSDKRAAPIVEEFAGRSDAAELAALAGNVALPAWPGFKLAWFQRELPQIARRAERFLVLKDYITSRLCGAATTDPSEASGTFLMDARTGSWSPRLLDALAIDRAQLPTIVAADEIVGELRGPVAKQVGLPTVGIPVVCGAGDMLCQLLAGGVTGAGRSCEVSGTASIMASYAEQPSDDHRVMNLRGVTDGWLAFGMADAGGATFRWFVDRFCEPVLEAAAASDRSAFELLTDEAATVPIGSDGLLFLPYLLGERTMGSPHSRGSIVGLTPGHGRKEVVRALLEGITFELRRTLELIDQDATSPLRILGGGGTSPTWNRIRAAVYGRPIARLRSHEGGLLGAGLLAAVGAGWYPDAAAAADQVVTVEDVLEPDAAERERYQDAYHRFCAVHDALETQWGAWRQVE